MIFSQFLVLIFLLLEIAQCTFPFGEDGIVNPPSIYERFRRDEYSNPFYQWWYYWVKDLKTDTHFAFLYMLSSSEFTNTSGVYVGFAMVIMNVAHLNRFPISQLKVTGDFNFQVPEANALFSIQVLADGVYRLKGKMIGDENAWKTSNWPASQNITWDLTFHRIYGWYGQPDFEELDEYYYGVIMWNTYTHNSEIEGQIEIGTQKFKIQRTSQYRGYGDMNWGKQFPTPPTDSVLDLSYAWGWYSACDISSNPFEDVCIIAGAGKSSTGFPLYGMIDIRIGNGTHVGVRSVYVDADKWISPHWSSTNDGDVIKYEVTKENWVTLSDEFGQAKIPLYQSVRIETSTYQIFMEYNSASWEYNRLLFPFRSYIFSDFEALGVSVNVTIRKNGVLFKQFSNTNGGLEYGTKFPVHLEKSKK